MPSGLSSKLGIKYQLSFGSYNVSHPSIDLLVCSFLQIIVMLDMYYTIAGFIIDELYYWYIICNVHLEEGIHDSCSSPMQAE